MRNLQRVFAVIVVLAGVLAASGFVVGLGGLVSGCEYAPRKVCESNCDHVINEEPNET